MSSELKSFEQARQDMRRIGILGYINEGARMMLLSLIEGKFITDIVPPLKAEDKQSEKKVQAHISAVIIKKMLSDTRFMDGVLLGNEIVLTWDDYGEKSKRYTKCNPHLKSDMRTIAFFEEAKDEEL